MPLDIGIVYDTISSLDERLKTINQLSMQAAKIGDEKLRDQLQVISVELDSSIQRLKRNFTLT